MNIHQLMDAQQELDRHIEKEQGINGKDYQDEKILALQVEVGELANEWRGFKFWSRDREPRTKKMDELKGYKNPLLEEYADGLSFILSIGNDLKIRPKTINYIHEKSITKQFNRLFTKIGDFYEFETRGNYYSILRLYLALGEMLGYSLMDIEKAYLEKNKTNHYRQDTGY
ncbi:hypothetical protein J416_09439 [Gracilibacillus halophilus YIM-C55.5]|uniref:dUTPase n=1 Tax=Gracilibacillus halophilus YIM-C55.5 TaxID=1308866 RepID=N4WQH5_9BACI|nr:dUTP diphosphatase [Gracilibacillus halophilus]ENH96710.1 hypothetical protein J416_09439 [Gracilibacillus halophilus YIM-C55.5]